MSCFNGRDVSTALGPGILEGSSRRRAMVGVVVVVQWAHVPACSSFCTDTKHRQSVTDAIDGISAGKRLQQQTGQTYRHGVHQARRRAERPQGSSRGKHVGRGVEWRGVLLSRRVPPKVDSIEARELLKERACACNSSDMEWLISGWALELGCRMNGVLLANCSHSHQPTGLANKPKSCLRPSHFAHPVRVIGWREATGRRARTALATTSPQSSRITHSPPSRPRLEPLSRHYP